MAVRIVVILLASIVASSCAPSLGSRLKVPDVFVDESKITDFDTRLPKVKIGNFLDARREPTLAIIDGREVMPEGDISDAVREAITTAFVDSGARVTNNYAPIIEGEIKDWQIVIKPGFPTTDLVAKSSLRVVVRDSELNQIYRATYNGESTKQHPAPGEDTIRETLSDAMAVTINEVFHDQDLKNKLLLAR